MAPEKAARKIVITGGPCCGKTTTIEALRAKGFSAVPEASRMLIEREQARGGDLVPWKRLGDFNAAVTALQLELEQQAREGTWFLDRGIVDNLAYCRWGKVQPPLPLLEALAQASYHKVFLLQPLPLFENDHVRKETPEQRAELHNHLLQAYLERGYEVIQVPPFSVEERVQFILGRL
ncbi:MAG: ATP-binding protein [Candidatus Aenigmarchaeota archaeon]|nr:ATP-binding protein [Candidatus Aenigmarchaeota archaeon]